VKVAGPAAAVLLLGGLFATGVGLGQLTEVLPLRPGHAAAPPGKYPVLAPSRPVKISIPAIAVRAPVHPVGLAEDGSIAVPALHLRNEAGWYDRSPSPGQSGPAIIVGHVDGARGPAVFHRLGQLRPGHLVEVTRRDRKVAVFRVDTVERYDKQELPAKVYGDFSRPGLRLITCGGRWIGGPTGYAENVVVYASLVSTHRA
jgi:sortase (surface protein transpeptidase)